MKKIILISSLITILISCQNFEPDCVCTEEFLSITVLIVDSLNNPVDSLNVDITDEFGRRIQPLNKQLTYQAGLYVVIDDSKLDYLSTEPLLLYFTASDSVGRNAYSMFVVNKDDCNCHVYKLSGAEKIVLK